MLNYCRHLGAFFEKERGTTYVSHPSHFGFDEWTATQGQAPTTTPNCGCFPPDNWTTLEPPIDYEPPLTLETWIDPHQPGENCMVGGGMRTNESYGCMNYWKSNKSDPRGCTNLTHKIEGSDGDYLVQKFADFVEKVGPSWLVLIGCTLLACVHTCCGHHSS